MSVNRESELALEADAEAVAAFLREHGGRLDDDEDSSGVYWLTLMPVSDPDEAYFARLAWSEYPVAPPSVKFAKSIGGALDDPRAWPGVPGFRAQSFDICMPFTAEGFALHPEWAGTSEAWRNTGNPFLYVASTLQRLLDTQYSGRFELVSAIELPRAAVKIVVAEVAAWGSRGVETGGFLLCEESERRVETVALSGGRGIGRARDQFVVSGKALARLFGYAEEHGLSVRAQFHSHGRSAFLSPTDLTHGLNVAGFVTTVVPHFAAPPEDPRDWRWWMYDGDWEEIGSPTPVEHGLRIVRFDEDGARAN